MSLEKKRSVTRCRFAPKPLVDPARLSKLRAELAEIGPVRSAKEALARELRKEAGRFRERAESVERSLLTHCLDLTRDLDARAVECLAAELRSASESAEAREEFARGVESMAHELRAREGDLTSAIFAEARGEILLPTPTPAEATPDAGSAEDFFSRKFSDDAFVNRRDWTG